MNTTKPVQKPIAQLLILAMLFGYVELASDIDDLLIPDHASEQLLTGEQDSNGSPDGEQCDHCCHGHLVGMIRNAALRPSLCISPYVPTSEKTYLALAQAPPTHVPIV